MSDTPPVRIYHNQRCSKSRAACQLIAERGVTAEIIDYLATPPSREDLRTLLKMLGMRPSELLRRVLRVEPEEVKTGRLLEKVGDVV